MANDNARLERNFGKFYRMSFLDGTWLLLPVYMIFFLDHQLSLTQIGLLLGACSAAQFLFEIPSSIWADKYSRRTVLIVYGLFHILIDTIYLFAGSFNFFLLAMVCSGIGNALISGTFSALLYDTVLSLGREKEYERVQSRVKQGEFAGRILASLLGAVFYFLSPALLFVAMIFIHGAYAWLAYTLSEPSREKSISTSWAQVREGIAFLRRKPMVWHLILLFSLMVATADISFSYYQPVLDALGLGTLSLGAFYVFINLFSFVGARYYPQISRQGNWKKMMLLFLLIDMAAAFLLGSGALLFVALAIALLSLSFGTHSIYIGNIVHKEVPSSHRATALSIQSQAYMLFYFLIVPIVSYLADHHSLAWGMWANAALVAAALLIFWQMARGRRVLGEEKTSPAGAA